MFARQTDLSSARKENFSHCQMRCRFWSYRRDASRRNKRAASTVGAKRRNVRRNTAEYAGSWDEEEGEDIDLRHASSYAPHKTQTRLNATPPSLPPRPIWTTLARPSAVNASRTARIERPLTTFSLFAGRVWFNLDFPSLFAFHSLAHSFVRVTRIAESIYTSRSLVRRKNFSRPLQRHMVPTVLHVRGYLDDR